MHDTNQLTEHAVTYTMKVDSCTSYTTGERVKNKWKHLSDNFCARVNKINATKSENPHSSPRKGSR